MGITWGGRFLTPNSPSPAPSLTKEINRLGEQGTTQHSPAPPASQHNQAIVYTRNGEQEVGEQFVGERLDIPINHSRAASNSKKASDVTPGCASGRAPEMLGTALPFSMAPGRGSWRRQLCPGVALWASWRGSRDPANTTSKKIQQDMGRLIGRREWRRLQQQQQCE